MRAIVHLAELHVPLVIARGYRGETKERHALTFQRRVACACALSGCSSCELVGWVLRTETIDIELPAGANIGTRLRLGGQGEALHPDATGDLVVEIVDDGERAAELRAAQRELEAKLAEDWATARAERAHGRRQGRRLALRAAGAVSAAAVVIGAFVLVHHLHKAEVGAPCNEHDDCRSSRCLSLRRALPVGASPQDGETLVPGQSRLAPTAERRVCTTDCASDRDCPASMTCESVRATNILAPNVSHAHRGCVPR